MMEIFGLVMAVAAAIGWGTNFVPFKKIKRPDAAGFQLVMCAGILATSLVAIPLLGFSFDMTVFGLLAGASWTIGNYLSLKSIESAGLAKSAPIWMGINTLASFLVGVALFSESISLLYVAAASVVAIVAGIFVVSRAHSSAKAGAGLAGILLAVLAGMFFVGYGYLLKLGGVTPSSFLFSISLGIMAASVAVFFAGRGRLDRGSLPHGLSCGGIWNAAHVSSLFSIVSLGLAVAVPITQMALLVAAAWGVFYFKEIKGHGNKLKVAAGAAIIIAGAFLLALSK